MKTILKVTGLIALLVPLVTTAKAPKEMSNEQMELYSNTIYAIESELDVFKLECGSYPTTAQGLIALLETPKGMCSDRIPALYLKEIPKTPVPGQWNYTSDGKTFDLKIQTPQQKSAGAKKNAESNKSELPPNRLSAHSPTAEDEAKRIHNARLTLVKKMGLAPVTKENADRFAEQAKKLLEENSKMQKWWSYQFSIHHANLLLGRVEIFKKNLDGAKKYLMKSTEFPLEPKAPQLSTIGPNMLLAKELLEAGEKKAVLAYLDACKRFWEMEDGLIEKWKKEINEGKTPDFGHNLKT